MVLTTKVYMHVEFGYPIKLWSMCGSVEEPQVTLAMMMLGIMCLQ